MTVVICPQTVIIMFGLLQRTFSVISFQMTEQIKALRFGSKTSSPKGQNYTVCELDDTSGDMSVCCLFSSSAPQTFTPTEMIKTNVSTPEL